MGRRGHMEVASNKLKSKDPERGAYCAGGAARKVPGLRPESFFWKAKACAGEAAQAVATCGRVQEESGKQGGRDAAKQAAQNGAVEPQRCDCAMRSRWRRAQEHRQECPPLRAGLR